MSSSSPASSAVSESLLALSPAPPAVPGPQAVRASQQRCSAALAGASDQLRAAAALLEASAAGGAVQRELAAGSAAARETAEDLRWVTGTLGRLKGRLQRAFPAEFADAQREAQAQAQAPAERGAGR